LREEKRKERNAFLSSSIEFQNVVSILNLQNSVVPNDSTQTFLPVKMIAGSSVQT